MMDRDTAVQEAIDSLRGLEFATDSAMRSILDKLWEQAQEQTLIEREQQHLWEK